MATLKLVGFVQVVWLLVFCEVAIAERIAVIGGGISGSFVTRYLVDYDQDCKIDSLTLFDPNPLGEYVTKDGNTNNNHPSWQHQQGSRVATLKLDDGRLVELGASILSEKFKFIQEMANAGNLTITPPFQTGFPEPDMNTGFLIYGGNGENLLNTANMTSFWKKFSIAWRYNLDFYLVTRAMQDFMQSFEVVQEQLADPDTAFFNSPEEMWKSVGLDFAVHLSLAEYCRKHLWVSDQLSWWRRLFMYGQGSLQEELLTGINQVNYNQDNEGINALSGLASFSVVSIPTYGIDGGNVKLVSSAWDQAQSNYCTHCGDKQCTSIRHARERISTVVGSLDGFELFGENGSLLGKYDIVILATPMSMCKIDFLIQSHVDQSVLQPMPLGKLIETHEDDFKIPKGHEGHSPLPRSLPPSVSRPYTQVVTTIVRNATLQTGYFSIDEQHIPRGIYMTAKGKAAVYNVTAISQISAQEGLYKIFSSQSLPHEALVAFFGSGVYMEYEKVWGGRHGGATPNYAGSSGEESTDFLIFDGATGFHGHTKSGALYYTNALELSLACIETSAMGAKAVAKLVARRLGWITPRGKGFGFGDEL